MGKYLPSVVPLNWYGGSTVQFQASSKFGYNMELLTTWASLSKP